MVCWFNIFENVRKNLAIILRWLRETTSNSSNDLNFLLPFIILQIPTILKPLQNSGLLSNLKDTNKPIIEQQKHPLNTYTKHSFQNTCSTWWRINCALNLLLKWIINNYRIVIKCDEKVRWLVLDHGGY